MKTRKLTQGLAAFSVKAHSMAEESGSEKADDGGHLPDSREELESPKRKEAFVAEENASGDGDGDEKEAKANGARSVTC